MWCIGGCAGGGAKFGCPIDVGELNLSPLPEVALLIALRGAGGTIDGPDCDVGDCV